MNKKYQPRALIYEDGNGAFTFSCKTKEIAQKVIQQALDEYINDNADEKIICALKEIEQRRMYECRKCGFYTIDEALCMECGRELKGNGRDTFTFSF